MSDPVIELRGVSKAFGDNVVLDSVDPVSYTHLTLPTSDLV